MALVVGFSGSGKTTLARNISNKYNIECYELDDLIYNWNFNDEQLKEYGDLFYKFFS